MVLQKMNQLMLQMIIYFLMDLNIIKLSNIMKKSMIKIRTLFIFVAEIIGKMKEIELEQKDSVMEKLNLILNQI